MHTSFDKYYSISNNIAYNIATILFLFKLLGSSQHFMNTLKQSLLKGSFGIAAIAQFPEGHLKG